MKRNSTSKIMSASILLLALLFIFTDLSAQTVISQWNNYVSPPPGGKFLATAGIAPNKNAAILTRDAAGTNFTVPTSNGGGVASSTGWALDRYWEATFETTNYENWDGKYNGRNVPAGTYLYVVLIYGEKKYSGTVTVIY